MPTVRLTVVVLSAIACAALPCSLLRAGDHVAKSQTCDSCEKTSHILDPTGRHCCAPKAIWCPDRYCPKCAPALYPPKYCGTCDCYDTKCPPSVCPPTYCGTRQCYEVKCPPLLTIPCCFPGFYKCPPPTPSILPTVTPRGAQ